MEREITVAEAAGRIGLASRTIADWRWRVKAGLPVSPEAADLVAHLHHVGSRWYVSEGDLDRWLERRKGPSRPAPEVGQLQAEAVALVEHLHAAGRAREARLVEVVAEMLGGAA